MRGGGGGDFPVVEGRSTSTSPATTSHVVTLPAGIVAGDVVAVFISLGILTTSTWPGSWVERFDDQDTDALSVTIGTLVASGGETSVTVESVEEIEAAHVAYRISGASGNAEASAKVTGSSVSPDPPSLSPSWGSKKTLWLPVAASAYNAITGGPADYTNFKSSGVEPFIGTAERLLEAASEDPGVFTMSAEAWLAATLAVEPA